MFHKTVTRLVPYLPPRLVERIAARYIAGTSADDALRVVRALQARGFVTTLDILGEDTNNLEMAAQAADAYIELLSRLASEGAPRNVSVKLTQLGLRLDEEVMRRHLTRLLDHARGLQSFVRIDMEDATLTDTTLRIHRKAVESGYKTGTVLQARLKRTRRDATNLKNASLRLCKGAYKEASSIAYDRHVDIRKSYMDVFHTLIDNGCRVAAATHDLKLIARIRRTMASESIPKDRVEFQALLGVPIRSTLESLREEGYSVRLYVPYGASSMSYSLRRLHENPELAAAIVKSLFENPQHPYTKALLAAALR